MLTTLAIFLGGVAVGAIADYLVRVRLLKKEISVEQKAEVESWKTDVQTELQPVKEYIDNHDVTEERSKLKSRASNLAQELEQDLNDVPAAVSYETRQQLRYVISAAEELDFKEGFVYRHNSDQTKNETREANQRKIRKKMKTLSDDLYTKIVKLERLLKKEPKA